MSFPSSSSAALVCSTSSIAYAGCGSSPDVLGVKSDASNAWFEVDAEPVIATEVVPGSMAGCVSVVKVSLLFQTWVSNLSLLRVRGRKSRPSSPESVRRVFSKMSGKMLSSSEPGGLSDLLNTQSSKPVIARQL